MVARGTKSFLLILTLVCSVFLPTRLCAQDPMSEGAPELVDVANLSGAAIPPPLKDLVQPEIPVSEKRAMTEAERAQLAPKVEQALGRAYGILGSNLTAQGAAEARKYLEAAYRVAPANATGLRAQPSQILLGKSART